MNDTLSLLTGNHVDNPREVIEQGWVGSVPYNTGCLIKTEEVHSICKGKVLAVDRDPKNNTWSITVEVNSQKWIRYCRMASFKVSVGQTLTFNDFLGFSNKGLMRLEYCTSETSQFPVRVLKRQLFKHDPTPIIFGIASLMESY